MGDDGVNAEGAGGDRPPDEKELALRASRGDRRAFAELYERHVDAVYRYVYFRLRSDADAQDVTSEVFQRALVAMPRYEPRRPFLAYVYTIARNVVADRFRRVRPTASFEDALDHPTDVPGPEESSIRADEARRLRAAIGRLTELQQEVVIFKFIEGRDTREIAQLTGKAEATIRGIQMRALAALRDVLGADATEGTR